MFNFIKKLLEETDKWDSEKEEGAIDEKKVLSKSDIRQTVDALSPDIRYRQSLAIDEPADLKTLLQQADFPEVEIEEADRARIERLKNISKKLDEKPPPPNPFNKEKKYQIDYENELNEEQLTAMSIIDKPLLVIAGAGSGKTRTIVHKVAYLIENGIPPSEILLLTFTRKAANEMLDRVKMLLGKKFTHGVLGGTFHSFSNHILRKYSRLAGVPSNFTIIDATDSADTLSLLRDELFPGKREKTFPRKRTLAEIVSKSGDMEMPIDKVIKEYFPNYTECIEEVTQISEGYRLYKKNHNLFDYSDLMTVLREELKNNEVFRNAVQKKINYVLVDEYQDTNSVQREIVELIDGKRGIITAVGDDAQSIYSFRGANYENILRFSELFPDCRCVKIEENYRSGQEILDFTNEIVKNAQLGFKKKLRTTRYAGQKPTIKNFADSSAEAEFIADKILELRSKDLGYSNFAVLTRAGDHSNTIQIEFLKRGMPYIVYGGIKFNERKHIRDIVAFLRIILNPIDAVSWHRILKFVRGVGRVRATKIIGTIGKNNGNIIFDDFSNEKWYKPIRQYEEYYQASNEKTLPAAAIKSLMKFYKVLLKQEEHEDYQVRLEDINTLITIADGYSNLEGFLTDFALEPNSNKYTKWQSHNEPDEKKDKEHIVISTIHSAKGLEWHTVFVPHALDGCIPSSKSLGSLEEIEEERRVFYVATTRAKEILFITMPAYVSSWDAIFTLPSRFIKEIGSDCYETG